MGRSWRTNPAARNLAIVRAQGRCERCRVPLLEGHYHVHHLHYYTKGQESPGDLEVLCLKCHRKEHPDREILSTQQIRTRAAQARNREGRVSHEQRGRKALRERLGAVVAPGGWWRKDSTPHGTPSVVLQAACVRSKGKCEMCGAFPGYHGFLYFFRLFNKPPDTLTPDDLRGWCGSCMEENRSGREEDMVDAVLLARPVFDVRRRKKRSVRVRRKTTNWTSQVKQARQALDKAAKRFKPAPGFGE